MKVVHTKLNHNKVVALSCGCTINDQTAELTKMCKQHEEAYFMS